MGGPEHDCKLLFVVAHFALLVCIIRSCYLTKEAQVSKVELDLETVDALVYWATMGVCEAREMAGLDPVWSGKARWVPSSEPFLNAALDLVRDVDDLIHERAEAFGLRG